MKNMLKLVSPRFKNWVPASVAIVVSLCIAVFVWNQRQERLRNDLQADFSYESREIAVRLQDRMTAYKQVLRGVRSSLASVGVPGRDEWTVYVKNLFLEVDFPGVQGIGFAPNVPLDGLTVHEKRMQTHGYPGYSVARQPSGFEHVAPISRLAPESDENKALIGTDLMGFPPVAAVLNASSELANTRLSPAFLMGKQPTRHVFLVQPIYSAKQPAEAANTPVPTTMPPARPGWMFAVFETRQLIQSTLGALPDSFRLQVFVDANMEPEHLIYDTDEFAPRDWGGEKPLEVLTQLEIDGQMWTLVFEGFPRAYSRGRSINWEFFSILTICVLFSVSVLLLTVTRRNSNRLLTMTNELQNSNDRYQFLATHDALTKVANRVLFQARLETTLAEAVRYGRQFGLIYIDLDKFKPVNDEHGHHAGDVLLVGVTTRLAALLRDSDLLARRGGDEFVVLLPTIDSVEGVEIVAQKICAELARPFDAGGFDVQIGGSLGIAVFPRDGTHVDQLILRADQRMYLAKQRGGNRWVSDGPEVDSPLASSGDVAAT